VLDVPRFSQMIHQGEYPQYAGGGEAWCSPTSTAMVLGYYRALPPRSEYRWVDPDYRDRVVDHLARMTYDRNLSGTGNWAFNTAYAAGRTGHASVTRLRNLREAERFIAAGIPLVASVTFGSGELSGAPISSTNGHLLVIVGFRRDGDVVVHDPAASTRKGVRRTYDRGQFEDAWLKRYSSGGSVRGSGGLVYVVRDADHPLPDRERNRNW
jgi:Peptidase_C39 like family